MNPAINITNDIVSLGYSESCTPTQNYALHCHNFYEVYFFLDGDVDYLVEGRSCRPTPNSLLLLSPHTFHGVKINGDRPYRRFSIHFHPDILAPERRSFLLSVFPAFEKEPAGKIYYENVDKFHIPAYFDALEDCLVSENPKKQEMLLSISIEALLSRILFMRGSGDALPSASPSPNAVADILWYLNRHMREPVTLDQLSERFFISKHHLNKVFRKATGTTVLDYLLHKRITAARQLLITGSNAREAAEMTGFHDYSAFYRAYIKINCHSPLKDRGVLPSLSSGMEKGAKSLPLKEREPGHE